MASRVMTVDQALEYAAQFRIVLVYTGLNSVEPFTPGGPKLPMAFKRSIYKYQAELAARMRAGDAKLCPAKRLHRRSWRLNGLYMQCYLCVCLDKSMSNDQEERIAS